MADPVWFIVERNNNGEEYVSIYYDVLPTRLKRTVTEFEKPPIIFQLRLDTLPTPEFWLERDFEELYYLYKSGKLKEMLK